MHLSTLFLLPLLVLAQAQTLQPITSCTKSSVMSLSFDDGPTYGNVTADISRIFENKKAKTTFFVNGNNYRCIYDAADELLARFGAGHQIASHGWSHVDFTSLTIEQIHRQINLTEIALEKILGIKPKYFRPPFGAYNDQVLRILAERGYRVVTWDFDSGDSVGVSAKDSVIAYKKLADARPRNAMALNHDTIDGTSRSVVPQVVPYILKKGFKLVTIAECLNDPQAYQKIGRAGKRDASWTCAGTPAPGQA